MYPAFRKLIDMIAMIHGNYGNIYLANHLHLTDCLSDQFFVLLFLL